MNNIYDFRSTELHNSFVKMMTNDPYPELAVYGNNHVVLIVVSSVRPLSLG